MTGIPVQIVMDDTDFGLLVNNSGEPWAGNSIWASQVFEGRFELDGKDGETPSLHWKFVYGLGRNYAAVILARAFLAAKGHVSQAARDTAEPGAGGWILLTNYRGGREDSE